MVSIKVNVYAILHANQLLACHAMFMPRPLPKDTPSSLQCSNINHLLLQLARPQTTNFIITK